MTFYLPIWTVSFSCFATRNAEDGCCVRKFWQVPKSFVFPKCDRKVGWSHWLLGLPNFAEKQTDESFKIHPILPFRHMEAKYLPKKVRRAFTVNWKPVYSIMDEAIVSGNATPLQMTADELEWWWEAGNTLLKARVAYCFEKPRSNL